MDDKVKEFQKRLTEAMERKNITNAELSRRIEKSKTAITLYRTGESIPRIQIIEKLSDALDVPFKWLNLETDDLIETINSIKNEEDIKIMEEFVEIPLYSFNQLKNENQKLLIKSKENIYLNLTLLENEFLLYEEDLLGVFAFRIDSSLVKYFHQFSGKHFKVGDIVLCSSGDNFINTTRNNEYTHAFGVKYFMNKDKVEKYGFITYYNYYEENDDKNSKWERLVFDCFNKSYTFNSLEYSSPKQFEKVERNLLVHGLKQNIIILGNILGIISRCNYNNHFSSFDMELFKNSLKDKDLNNSNNTYMYF